VIYILLPNVNVCWLHSYRYSVVLGERYTRNLISETGSGTQVCDLLPCKTRHCLVETGWSAVFQLLSRM